MVEMRCGGEFFGFWGGREDTIKHQATSMSYSGFCQLGGGGIRRMEGLPGRKPGCFPDMVCSWVTRSWLVLRICSFDGRGMVSYSCQEQLVDGECSEI